LFGLAIHALFDGVSIASGFLVSANLGFLVFGAVVLHKLPEGFTVASIALASGRSKAKGLTGACVLAAATLVGVAGMHVFSGAVAFALPFSTGVTLYVAASDLIPAVNEEDSKSLALTVFLGVALFYVAEILLEGLGLGH
jgi:ZIP family zinc transporter/zinc and cadmium transporter